MQNKDSSAEEIEDAGSHPLKDIGLMNDGDVDSVPQWAKEEEKKLVRTIDWRVFPMLCTIFGLSLLDRTNISSAYIAGLGADIQLSQGIWLIRNPIESRHPPYRCQGVAEFPDYIMGRLRPGDGLFFPGAVFIIGSWYRQYETATRVSLFYMAALIASGFGPILAYVFSLIRVGDGIYTQGWRWIFIIEGIATIVAGIAAAFFLVEFPDKASWLTPRQKQIAIARLSVDKLEKEYKHPSFKEAMVMIWDWKIIVFSIQYFIAASSVYSIAYFKTIILREGMGFSYALSQILSSPPYVFAVIMSLVMAWLSDKYKIRWAILVAQSLSAVVGLLITLYSGPPGVRYFGLFIAVFGTQANIPGTLSYGQSQIPTVEKRGVIAAAMISVGAAGGIAGSTIFRTQDAPRYLPGMWATIAMQMLYTVVTLVFSFYLKRQNRLVDEGKRGDLEGVSGFRYAP
ncbi:major facilitator superfamily domain-containing protein [Aspergillus caelatus]|uniref:Major facilitator superfamily domain-containing protein n=1 Tax=Aspergillus caelatus TaxID=61420 RepID=A0A5N7ACZ2_9EURO|nr:major facilitator superfamily domain-containing protein [Aspergillus caelatus]KAE8367026.1 major facilitator superfamily domain-containing protein [Aspergillus caelatus]